MAITTNHDLEEVEKGQLDADEVLNTWVAQLDKSLPYLVSRTTGINAKTAAATTLYTVPTGKRFIPTLTVLYPTNLSAPGTNPHISLGGNSSSFDDFSSNAMRDLDTVGNTVISSLNARRFTLQGQDASGCLIAPDRAGRVVSASFVNKSVVAANDTNYYTFTITNKATGGGSNAMLLATDVNTTKATGGSALAAYTRRALSLHATPANLEFAANDVLELLATATAAPTALAQPCWKLECECAEGISYAAAATFSLKVNTAAAGTTYEIAAEVFGYLRDA